MAGTAKMAKDSSFIKFLGTAGARFVVAKQLRASGGVYISAEGQNIMLDPGPGTLVRCAKSRPSIDVTTLDAVILTHTHIDHSNDVNVLIDGMTQGGFKKRGKLFAPSEALEGENAVVLKYLRDFLEEIVTLAPDKKYKIGGLAFRTSIRHKHPSETYGIRFKIGKRTISFMVDTQFFSELIENYKGSDILVMNVVRLTPHESGEVMHLCIDDVKKIVSGIKPKKAILTHFGMTMVRAKPWELAKKLSDELGIEVQAASDGMTVEL